MPGWPLLQGDPGVGAAGQTVRQTHTHTPWVAVVLPRPARLSPDFEQQKQRARGPWQTPAQSEPSPLRHAGLGPGSSLSACPRPPRPPLLPPWPSWRRGQPGNGRWAGGGKGREPGGPHGSARLEVQTPCGRRGASVPPRATFPPPGLLGCTLGVSGLLSPNPNPPQRPPPGVVCF